MILEITEQEIQDTKECLSQAIQKKVLDLLYSRDCLPFSNDDSEESFIEQCELWLLRISDYVPALDSYIINQRYAYPGFESIEKFNEDLLEIGDSWNELEDNHPIRTFWELIYFYVNGISAHTLYVKLLPELV